MKVWHCNFEQLHSSTFTSPSCDAFMLEWVIIYINYELALAFTLHANHCENLQFTAHRLPYFNKIVYHDSLNVSLRCCFLVV